MHLDSLNPVNESSLNTHSPGYRPDVDGLRAVAVLLVLFFHAGLVFDGGFVGVDVFFVISGFVITRLIKREVESGHFSMSKFWIRRIRRILPASIAVCVVTLLLSSLILFPEDFENAAITGFSQQLMAANIYLWKTSDYFNPAVELNPLLHTWSLAVEEQFYLVYPLVLAAILRWYRRGISFILMTGILASLTLSEWGVRHHPTASFYLLPTRAWELLIGALLCFLPTGLNNRRWISSFQSILGCVLIAYAAISFDSETRFPGVMAILPCIGTALIIYSNADTARQNLVGRLLSTRLTVSIGLMSYSLYLWHWPILSFTNHLCVEQPSTLIKSIALIIAFPISYLSWRLIENPIRTSHFLPTTKTLLIAIATSIAFICFSTYTIGKNDGFPNRLSAEVRSLRSASDEGYQATKQTLSVIQEGNLPRFGDTDGHRKCLLWGDSHAMMLIPCLDEVLKSQKICGLQATYNSTPPIANFVYSPTKYGLDDLAPEWNQSVLEFVQEQNIEIVIMAGVWKSYAERENFDSELTRTITTLRETGVKVLITKDVPWHRANVPLMLAKAKRLGRDINQIGISVEEHRFANQVADAAIDRLEKIDGITIIDPTETLADEDQLCRCYMDNTVLYGDAHHLTVNGALRLRSLYLHAINELLSVN